MKRESKYYEENVAIIRIVQRKKITFDKLHFKNIKIQNVT